MTVAKKKIAKPAPAPKKIGAKVPQRMTEKERERIVEQDDGTAVFVREAAKQVLERSEWDDCPRCAERAAKDAERLAKQVAANKRYREKRGKKA